MKINKIILTSIAMFLLTGCELNALPQKISQDKWASSKKFVKLKTGIKMAYVEMGDKNGPDIILQHGMTDNSRSWSMAAPFFAEQGYHVYLPDLRGMGKSEAPDGFYTPVTYATDLKAFCDAMNITDVTAVGHSLGSFTVQTFSIMFPELVNKLVLVSSIPMNGFQNDTLFAAYNAYVAPLPDDGHPSDAFMDSWYATVLQEEEFREEFEVFIECMKKEAQVLSKQAWKNIMVGLTATNLMTAYSLIDPTIPVLVLHGNDDTMTTNEYQSSLCEIFNVDANSFRNYIGIGHNIQFEMPRRCATDILTWLETGSLPQE